MKETLLVLVSSGPVFNHWNLACHVMYSMPRGSPINGGIYKGKQTNKLDRLVDSNMEATAGEAGTRVEGSPITDSTDDKSQKCCSHGFIFWCQKYFWEGQELKGRREDDVHQSVTTATSIVKNRRLMSFLIPAVAFHFFWWALVIEHNLWSLFSQHYLMTITMVFGSIVAGMTSEGGGAVAFPVMTLALKIEPSVARDFSMMIQSFGMSAASFAIIFMRVRIEERALFFCSLGGVAGIIFGLHVVDPVLPSSTKKLVFVSIWFAFASVLVFLNHAAKRPTFNRIWQLGVWKAAVLASFGFFGGIFTSFSGSGIDICSFMILTLFFRISEKVATPTSVVLMAVNSVVGFYWRGIIVRGISQDAWQYLVVCLPVVVVGAPIGSLVGSHFHRLVLASLVIVLDTVALISAFAIVRPLTPTLIGICVTVIVVCFVIFMGLTIAGQKMMDKIQSKEKSLFKNENSMDAKDRPSSPCVVTSECHVNEVYVSTREISSSQAESTSL